MVKGRKEKYTVDPKATQTEFNWDLCSHEIRITGLLLLPLEWMPVHCQVKFITFCWILLMVYWNPKIWVVRERQCSEKFSLAKKNNMTANTRTEVTVFQIESPEEKLTLRKCT